MVAERIINLEPLTQAYKSLNQYWRLLAIGSVLAITFEFLYFVCCAIPWSKFGIPEWAYWVGAVGTTGTLIGTIWLASSEKRERTRRELDLALVVCGGMILKIIEIQLQYKNVGQHLKATTLESFERVKWYAELLGELPKIEFSDLAALIILPNNTATKLAALVTELDWSERQIIKRSKGEIADFDEELVYMCVQTGRRMVDSSERLLEYKAEIVSFMTLHNCSIV